MTRHCDWWKRFPSCLTEPLPAWRGTPPTGSDDPAWPPYRKMLLDHQDRVIRELAIALHVRLDQPQDDFNRDLLMSVLDLTPAFEAVRETRGCKQNPDAEPESIAQRNRRAARRAYKSLKTFCP
jgi:hypothetical protein